MSLCNLTIAPSSIFPVHAPLVDLIRGGAITQIYTAHASTRWRTWSRPECCPGRRSCRRTRTRTISRGIGIADRRSLHRHAGRRRLRQYERCHGAGPMRTARLCGCRRSIRETSRRGPRQLVPYPSCPVAISRERVDIVVAVQSIWDASRIVSGTTTITEDRRGFEIVSVASPIIKAAGLLHDGFSFQTGADGTSLAVAKFVQRRCNLRRSLAASRPAASPGKSLECSSSVCFVRCSTRNASICARCSPNATMPRINRCPRRNMRIRHRAARCSIDSML